MIDPLDPIRPRRRSTRLRGYDYSRAGAYFVTICTRDRACLFGDVVDDAMVLNGAGRVVQATWDALPTHFPSVQLDAFVLMPNHVHAIVVLVGVPVADAGVMNHAPTESGSMAGARFIAPARRAMFPGVMNHAPTMGGCGVDVGARFIAPARDDGSTAVALGSVVRGLKARTTHAINVVRGTPGVPVWQRNYYEHIIRDDAELDRVRLYVADNPRSWARDRENPAFVGEPLVGGQDWDTV